MHSLPHTLDLPFAPPYDVDALLAAQRTHAVPGIDALEPSLEGTHDVTSPIPPDLVEAVSNPARNRATRSWSTQNRAEPNDHAERTAEPPDAVITRGIRHNGLRGAIRVAFGDDRVTLTSSLPIDAPLTRRVRRWLDLDVDPAAAASQFGDDPVIGPLIGKRPGLRIFGHIDDLEAACFAVLGQQVSLASARTFQRRFVATFGALNTTTGFRHLPDAAEIAALDPLEIRDAIGLTRSRAATLHAIVAELAAGLTLDDDGDSIRHRLLAIKGIGPWTADYLAVRAIGDRNAFPAGDLVLRRAMGAADAREATRRSEPWHPLRAYATFHLWTEHAYCAVR